MSPLWPKDRAEQREPLDPSALVGEIVAVWGAARSGRAAANLLQKIGAHVVLSDNRPESELDLEGIHPEVEVRGGGNVLAGARWLVPSPGIRPGAKILEGLEGVRLISEIELAAAVAQAPVVAITGTDGKSTTTLMCAAAIRGAGRPVVVAGNIGDPLCDHIHDVGPDGVVVAEVSAFQLWSCGHFRPQVAIITNVAEDHGDYFDHDRSAYALAKARLLWDLEPGDTAILRRDDQVVWSMPNNPGVAQVGFSIHPQAEGWGYAEGQITLDGHPVMPDTAVPAPGVHNVANAQAALAAGLALGLPLDGLIAGLADFEGLPHRLQPVAEIAGVSWFDDSKATNPHAAAVGLRSLPGPIVAVVGGYDKGLDLDLMVQALHAQARAVIYMGPAGQRVAEALGEGLPLYPAEDMTSAVEQAQRLAQPGDQVVLSPGASSFDAYTSYAHRGRDFQRAVKAL
ncbi:MAG: UDP-N-acetylmuramoyl-L-alanine--D-glutamate ligase [Bradymonadia bacterium]